MTSPARVRVLTPEHLDQAAANLVNTVGTQLATAVASKAGTTTGAASGTSAATANALMQRDANARAQVVDPAVGADIATKNYVDTTVSGYVATSTKGAASGVASLDGSSFVVASQLPLYLARQMGTGTTLPTTGNRQGDTYYHTGVNCLFEFDSFAWRQAGPISVADIAGRDTMKASLPAGTVHNGFTVWVTSQNQNHVWDTSSGVWRGTRTLAPQNAPVFGALTLTTAQSPYALATLVVPDPGFPYYLSAMARAEGGSTAAGTRWDTNIQVVQGATTSLMALVVHYETSAFTSMSTGPAVGPSGNTGATAGSGAFTGGLTAKFITSVVYGSANASYTQYNNTMSVQVVPA